MSTSLRLGLALLFLIAFGCAAPPPKGAAELPATIAGAAPPTGLRWDLPRWDTGEAAEWALIAGSACAGPSPVAAAADAGPVPVSAADPQWGSRDAPVTIVEFADFQCPFCRKVSNTLAELKKTYGPSLLRIVWKNNPLPFHTHARSAAQVALALFVRDGNDSF